MTRLEQIYLVNEMADSLRHSLLEQINAGKVPEEWGARELDSWFAQRADELYQQRLYKVIARKRGKLRP